MIYETEPNTWKELQNKVAEILNESGMNAKVEYHPVSARSDIEIDVFACERIGNRENIFVIECKNWNHKIPQTIVHAVRTVVQDVGGNTGYIISRKGFQKGAYEAAKLTNIKLLTWNEFQDLFEDQWREKHFDEYIEQHWSKIIDYSDPFFWPKWANELSDNKKNELRSILYKMDKWALLLLKLKIKRFFIKEEQIKLPLKQYDFSNNFPTDLINIFGYKEIIDKLHIYCDSLLIEYENFKNDILKNK